MRRPLKIDNAAKKRFERQEKTRAVGTRVKRLYFLIVCEGEKTEPNYFLQLGASLPKGVVEVKLKIEGAARNTNSLIKYTKAYLDKSSRSFDRVWVVFDKDSFSDVNFNAAIENAASNNIMAAWTNEAFELWFLLHFQYVNHRMSRDDYQSYLEREVKRVTGKDYTYKKNDPNMHVCLSAFGNQKQAITWAQKLERQFTDSRYARHNPCTKVHLLIKELQNPEQVWRELNR